MHAILVFFGVWGGYVGFSAVFFSVALWAVSVDENAQGKKLTADWLRAMFWPFIWLYLRFAGRDPVSGSRSRAPSASAEERNLGSTTREARRFRTVREAKDYLAGRIADKAKREGTPLTEVERKMLYFTETGWTLPDMKAVSAEFDRDYDQDEYERKIGGLVGKIVARKDAGDEQESAEWNAAVERLGEEDHYILGLIDAAQPHKSQENWVRHSLKVVAAALALFAFAALELWFRHWMRDH